MILNKFLQFISRAKTRYISFTHYQFYAYWEASCSLQQWLLHKTQVNSLRTEETLVDAPHKAVEKEGMVTVHKDKWPASDVLES